MNTTLQLAKLLLSKHWKISTAESCTGGMISARFTDIAGSSDWFERGYVTYSNEAKVQDIGVPAELIAKHGAVSVAVAEAMARGTLAASKANIALSVTGVAGPTGGSLEKPVGFVCFAWAWIGKDGIECISESVQLIAKDALVTSETRALVRNLATDHAIRRAYEIVN